MSAPISITGHFSNTVLRNLNISLENKIIFIKESPLADANFLISYILKSLVQENKNICFVTLHNNLEHYQSVGKKLGYNLECVNNDNFTLINPLENLIETLTEASLDSIFDSIQNEIRNFRKSNDRPIYVVIDDLSHFIDLGLDITEIIRFINDCVNLTSDPNTFFVINSHVSSQKDLILAHSVQYVCNLFINVSALKTGKSSDISGVIKIQKQDEENVYHYKVFDRGVKTFFPGETIYNFYK
ncbi:hypothetical protein ABEB36_014735 [Hypothenemus hampei]|uniref:Elongator complex protein 6 n=1 Tax=Hypothenemus hampei TaxID=57062 RepID=A0ABD1E7B1_HYPHA